MSSFIRYANEEHLNFTLDDLNNIRLIGNLEYVNENNLTKIEPKNLVLNKEYLILNRDNNEKTRAKFIRVNEIYDPIDGSTEILELFEYIFNDIHGELIIESNCNYLDEGDDNSNPYDNNITFDEQFGIFIPQSNYIILNKIVSEIVPIELLIEISKY